MAIHPPKYISSSQGLGLNTDKEMLFTKDGVAIGTERWSELLEKPWSESGVIIAQEGYKWVTRWEAGKPYIITKFLNEEDKLVGVYCDVSTPVTCLDGNFEFTDLYLDVWQAPDQIPIILDEDELREAVLAKYISKKDADFALNIAKQLVHELTVNPGVLDF